MGSWLPPTEKLPLYRARKRKPDRWTKKWLKEKRVLKPSLRQWKTYILVTGKISKLHRGVRVLYEAAFGNEKERVFRGIIHKRQRLVLRVLCEDRSEIHLITLPYYTANSKNYEKPLNERRLKKLGKQIDASEKLRAIASEIRKVLNGWHGQESYCDQAINSLLSQNRLNEAETSLMNKYTDLAKKVLEVKFSH